MRRLFLLRHAKAEAGSIDGSDHARSLAPRGVRQAAAMAEIFRREKFDPAIIFCSPSQRTRQTLEAMDTALSHRAGTHYLDTLYCSAPETLARTLEQEDDGGGDILLVGHNPGIASLALGLAQSDQAHDAAALTRLKGGYATCVLSVFETQTVGGALFSHPRWRLAAYFRPED